MVSTCCSCDILQNRAINRKFVGREPLLKKSVGPQNVIAFRKVALLTMNRHTICCHDLLTGGLPYDHGVSRGHYEQKPHVVLRECQQQRSGHKSMVLAPGNQGCCRCSNLNQRMCCSDPDRAADT